MGLPRAAWLSPGGSQEPRLPILMAHAPTARPWAHERGMPLKASAQNWQPLLLLMFLWPTQVTQLHPRSGKYALLHCHLQGRMAEGAGGGSWGQVPSAASTRQSQLLLQRHGAPQPCVSPVRPHVPNSSFILRHMSAALRPIPWAVRVLSKCQEFPGV